MSSLHENKRSFMDVFVNKGFFFVIFGFKPHEGLAFLQGYFPFTIFDG